MDHNSSSFDPPIEALDRLSVGMEEGQVSQLAQSSPRSEENEPTASTEHLKLSIVERLPPELIELIARHVTSRWGDDFHARSGGSASSMSKRMQETINYGLVCRSWLAPFRHEIWRSVNLSLTPPISPFWLRLAEAHKRGDGLSCNIERLAITENERVIPPDLAAAEALVANQLPAALSSLHELHLVGQSTPELWFTRSPRPLRFPELVTLSLYLHSPF
ncbi:hypothetical protein Rhopal_002519-T1 [Rhodotorula paludigena]|uniref:F-box domain-containing protein n=1 Tax=Rhodotorula paludigena TaxID=86838 RepID=A0AAV5GJJ4_9BASI|nr:hypothetical protein Rhopal_002519-T1 [Rhodotorula paludigena]